MYEGSGTCARCRVVSLARGGTAGGTRWLSRSGGCTVSRVSRVSRGQDQELVYNQGSKHCAGVGPTCCCGWLPLTLCGRTGESVASIDAVTDLVFRVPVLLLGPPPGCRGEVRETLFCQPLSTPWFLYLRKDFSVEDHISSHWSGW